MKTNPTPFSGVAAIQTGVALSTGKIAARLRDEAKGFKNEYEYGETGGGMWIRKTVWKDGSTFALFELDIEALPDLLVNLVSKFHREKYGCEPPVGDAQYWADTVTEWAKYTDETVCLDSPLVWIRCAIENGKPYSLSVPADATVCESCDVVLGNWTADEILEVLQDDSKHWINNRLDELVDPVLFPTIRWGVRTAFIASVISSVASFDGIDAATINEAPESEWADFCKEWNALYEHSENNTAPEPDNKKFWGDVYEVLSGENFEDRGL